MFNVLLQCCSTALTCTTLNCTSLQGKCILSRAPECRPCTVCHRLHCTVGGKKAMVILPVKVLCSTELSFIIYYCSGAALLHCIRLHCSNLHLNCRAYPRTAPYSTERHWNFDALHCSALNYTELHCSALYHTALPCTEQHCTALHCTALH